MMSKIDQTIETLLADVQTVKAVARPSRAFMVWFGLTLVATAVIAAFSAPRSDLMMQLHTPLYVAEVVVLFCLIISAALTATWLCLPDMGQKPWILYLPLPFLLLYGALMAYRTLHSEMTSILEGEAHNDFQCVICITIYSLVPGFWMFHTLRRYATTRPRLAGSLSLLTAASIGVLVLKFVEGNDSVLHLIQWHLIPVAVFGIIGAFLGKKFLSW